MYKNKYFKYLEKMHSITGGTIEEMMQNRSEVNQIFIQNFFAPIEEFFDWYIKSQLKKSQQSEAVAAAAATTLQPHPEHTATAATTTLQPETATTVAATTTLQSAVELNIIALKQKVNDFIRLKKLWIEELLNKNFWLNFMELTDAVKLQMREYMKNNIEKFIAKYKIKETLPDSSKRFWSNRVDYKLCGGVYVNGMLNKFSKLILSDGAGNSVDIMVDKMLDLLNIYFYFMEVIMSEWMSISSIMSELNNGGYYSYYTSDNLNSDICPILESEKSTGMIISSKEKRNELLKMKIPPYIIKPNYDYESVICGATFRSEQMDIHNLHITVYFFNMTIEKKNYIYAIPHITKVSFVETFQISKSIGIVRDRGFIRNERGENMSEYGHILKSFYDINYKVFLNSGILLIGPMLIKIMNDSEIEKEIYDKIIKK